jgi:hypothetical protein
VPFSRATSGRSSRCGQSRVLAGTVMVRRRRIAVRLQCAREAANTRLPPAAASPQLQQHPSRLGRRCPHGPDAPASEAAGRVTALRRLDDHGRHVAAPLGGYRRQRHLLVPPPCTATFVAHGRLPSALRERGAVAGSCHRLLVGPRNLAQRQVLPSARCSERTKTCSWRLSLSRARPLGDEPRVASRRRDFQRGASLCRLTLCCDRPLEPGWSRETKPRFDTEAYAGSCNGTSGNETSTHSWGE